MFISVQIRGPGQLVRRRTGEHVGNPIQAFEDGGAHHEPLTAFDLRHRTIDPVLTDLESFEVATELQLSETEDRLVAETRAFSSDAGGERSDPERQAAQRRRSELDRPTSLRRLLSHMHALSMLARPAKHVAVQRVEKGLAKVSFRVWRGDLTIGASVESFPEMPSHLTRGSVGRRPYARLRGAGRLDPDGAIRQLRLDVRLDHLPVLGPVEQAELDRLKSTFVRLHAEGNHDALQLHWRPAHCASADRRPELPLLLLVALLSDFQRHAVGVLDPAGQGRRPKVTLHDLMERPGDAAVPIAQEVDLSAETRLVWEDDHTPALDVPGCSRDELASLNRALRGILTYLPLAWTPGASTASREGAV